LRRWTRRGRRKRTIPTHSGRRGRAIPSLSVFAIGAYAIAVGRFGIDALNERRFQLEKLLKMVENDAFLAGKSVG
jgi:hypothetical protein